MIMFKSPPKVYLYRDFIDFRKSINGLSIIVEQQLNFPSTDGSVFVFCNKGRDKLQNSVLGQTGFALWYKRLELDKFKWPQKIDNEQWCCLNNSYNGYSQALMCSGIKLSILNVTVD
ncbi:IS66 family insertion sequence element accessory protein TnpB [Shewanella sp. 202IG2-18]|uniref:IS66 family insertion sequence element accessory protein TnpB n=1 Tax=Parashewanella hymeniacidonis TaxID=2807618 RepID=UPI0019621A04|nr:IS66 family insertion sequence element accessory protein TnpB [Parashewanella hymeniacidonis]MBM7072880.1 IS66 family insertion sequence element accessory protein TnpB [Parashewanella hymeniacidonis]